MSYFIKYKDVILFYLSNMRTLSLFQQKLQSLALTLHPQYIGETTRTVKDRIREYRGTIMQNGQVNTTVPVGVHFRQSGHKFSDLTVITLKDPMQWLEKFVNSITFLSFHVFQRD